MSRYFKYLSTFLICFSMSMVDAAPALAQDDPDAAEEEEEDDEATKSFNAGRKLYSEGKYKEAIDELLKAYKLRPAPPILLNVARTFEKLGKKVDALKYYKEYLQKARMVDPQRPSIELLVKKLEKEVKTKTGAVTTADGTETPDARSGDDEGGKIRVSRKLQMIHTPVDAAKVRHSITITAELPPRVVVDKVVLFFRKGGELKFRYLRMELQGEAYVTRIPAKYVTSTSLQYYIQAIKGTGRRSTVAEAGNKMTPHIVVIEGGRPPSLGPKVPVEIRSPYRTWMWVSGAVAVALIGGGAVGIALAKDRESALERWVDEMSCDANCQKNGMTKLGAQPKELFDGKARDWESEGQSFAIMGGVMMGLGIAAAGATGLLWFMDRKYVKDERRRRDADRTGPALRFAASPFVSPASAGVMTRLEF